MSNRLVLAAAAAALCSTSFAHAQSLIGSQVTGAIYCCQAPTESNRGTNLVTATVGPGVEFPQGSFMPLGQLNPVPVAVDVGATTIDINYNEMATAAPGAFNGFVFSFAGAPAIISVALDPASTLTPTFLYNNANMVFVDNAGLSITPDSRILINVTPVPEPAAYAMLLAGFGIAAWARWRHGRQGS